MTEVESEKDADAKKDRVNLENKTCPSEQGYMAYRKELNVSPIKKQQQP